MYTHAERLISTQKNHLKNCSLEVRHAFESKTSNLKLDQNTKTTHRKDLTKNKTPLGLAISKKPKIQPKIQPEMTNHKMMITG